MSDDDKEERILRELRSRAKQIKYGKLIIELTIHEEHITGGEIIEQRVKLG